ncbi:hypothetical protein BDY19DRAFT_880985 [Irpex rosettiformis]|uniref:Uncharacterized protein n=1 Tax=Irpex rosettiformis TaxID=378272 RepID=A0ACB8UJY7_9APHY|nr:hypothetical protein BDY19DRAFT_880985 [Irpex rosettiformis]
MDTQAPQTRAGMQTRQKRVLPSRSRRGGPGVGGCDVDVMILETRKRRSESEPLIPAGTKFLLTTNSSLVPPLSENDFELNTSAYSRYFDRPEVQQACKYQQNIQTPEFTQLPDDAIVGGRFRPRGSEDETADTSDAAYEKRHRKYETFEKRQRLREKEKLKHEQYKLKERIEQLRAMDTSAFLALPASKFSEPPGVMHHSDHFDDADTGISDLPGAHINGAAAYNEGERRRKEMLDIALSLEERYRVLLPPDRKWQEKKEKAKREYARQSVEHDYTSYNGTSSEPPHGEDWSIHDRPVTPPPPSEPESQSKQESDEETVAVAEHPHAERSKSLRLKIKFTPRPAADMSQRSTDANSQNISSKFHKPKTTIQTILPFASISTPPVEDSFPKVGRGANGRFVAKSKLHDSDPAADTSISQGPVKKRPRHSSPVSPAPSRHSHTSSPKTPCQLMLSAMRNAAAPAARKTNRHVTAFGVRVPPELEEIRDYELPYYVTSDGDGSDNEYFSNGDEGSVQYDRDFIDRMTWHDYPRENELPPATLYDS